MKLDINKIKKILTRRRALNFGRVWKRWGFTKRVPTVGLILLLVLGLVFGLFSFSFPVKEAEANGTTYYVDNCDVTGNDTNNGTSVSTPWLTINKVNTSSFNAGDSILFRKGCTWREQLTVPSSGSAGSPITFGAYGTGDDPIINGADLITPGTSWTASAGADGVSGGELINDNFDDNELTGWTVTGEAVAANQQLEVTVDSAVNTADNILSGNFAAKTELFGTYKIKLNSGHNFALNNSIQGTDLSSMVGLGFRNTSGVIKWMPMYRDDAGNTFITNLTTGPTDDAWHNIYLYWKAATGAGQNNGIAKVYVDRVLIYSKTDIDSDTRTATYGKFGNNFCGTVTASIYYDDIKVGTTGSDPSLGVDNTWSASVVTEPNSVWLDTTLGTAVASQALCVADGDWYWAGGLLYVYSLTDPDTAYTSPGIESGTRNYCINVNAKSYLAFQDLSLKYPNLISAYGDGTSNTIIFDGVDSTDSYQAAYYVDTISNLTIQNSIITGNQTLVEESPAGAFLWGHTITTATITGNTISGGSADALKHGIGIYFVDTCSDLQIDNNIISTIWGHGIDVSDDISTVVIENNDITTVGYGYTQAYGGIVLAAGVGTTVTGGLVRYNNVDDAGGSGIILWRTTASQVYYNIVSNTGNFSSAGTTSGIKVYNSDSGSFVYNNTIYNVFNAGAGQGIGIEYRSTASGLSATNNIVSTVKTWLRWDEPADITANYNNYYPDGATAFRRVATNSTFAAWKTASSQDANSFVTDPLFVSIVTPDFRLQSTSPCINAGTNVGLTRDYAGNPMSRCPNSNPDIGAYEYQSTCGGGTPSTYSNPPIPGINGFRCIINNNDAKTTSRDVSLTLEAGSNVKYAAVSEKPDLSGAGFESFEPEIFIKPFTLSLGDGLKKVYAQFLTAYNRFSDIVSDEIVLDTSSSAKQEEQPKPEEQAEVPKSPETTVILDGDLIRAINGFDVYIVKLVGAKKFKRLILNPDIFNQYKHLKWENVKEVSQEILDQYTTSDLVRALGDIKVYKLYPNGDVGEKRWIKTLEDFLSFAYDWDAVYMINNYERDSYSNGVDLASQ